MLPKPVSVDACAILSLISLTSTISTHRDLLFVKTPVYMEIQRLTGWGPSRPIDRNGMQVVSAISATNVRQH
jgi:hypothetical protein